MFLIIKSNYYHTPKHFVIKNNKIYFLKKNSSKFCVKLKSQIPQLMSKISHSNKARMFPETKEMTN
jgi:hypothetical protein